MTRGTTPTISFSFSEDELDIQMVDYAELTISQNQKNIIIKKLAFDSKEQAFLVALTEKETLLLKAGSCQMQVKIKLKDKNIVSTNIETVLVNEILNGEVML